MLLHNWTSGNFEKSVNNTANYVSTMEHTVDAIPMRVKDVQRWVHNSLRLLLKLLLSDIAVSSSSSCFSLLTVVIDNEAILPLKLAECLCDFTL